MIHLAWRNLTQNRAQFFLGVSGVALALVLMLALDALLAGSEDDLVAYIETSGADIFVAQHGVKNMHMAASAITWRDLRAAEQVSDVTTASPILYTTSIVKTGATDVLSYIIGFDPGAVLGGPRQVVAGRKTLDSGEVIIDLAVSRGQGVAVGDEVEIMGRRFRVAGITRGLTNIVNSVSFITLSDFQELRGEDAVSYGLLQVTPGVAPARVAEEINRRHDAVTALSVSDFSREERQIITDMSVEILNIMNLSGFLIGLAVTALTLYTSTLRKRQEYGVLKAIGAKNGHLYAVVTVQTVLSLTLGLVIAASLVWLLGRAIPLLVPGMGLLLTPAAIGRVLIASLLIGVTAALIPAWQLARLNPAQVFRG